MRSVHLHPRGSRSSHVATLSYGLVLFDGATQESALGLVIGGTVVGGFLGLLVAELTRSSGARSIPLIPLGAFGGLLAGLVYGVIALEEAANPVPLTQGPADGCS